MATKEENLKNLSDKLNEFCHDHMVPKAKVGYLMGCVMQFHDQETKELKQQLTEANALIESIGDALMAAKYGDPNFLTRKSPEQKEKVIKGITDYQTYVEIKRINKVQTTQEVKP